MSNYRRAGWRNSRHNAAHGRARRAMAAMNEEPVCEECGGIGFVANPDTTALPRMVDCPRCAKEAES